VDQREEKEKKKSAQPHQEEKGTITLQGALLKPLP